MSAASVSRRYLASIAIGKKDRLKGGFVRDRASAKEEESLTFGSPFLSKKKIHKHFS